MAIKELEVVCPVCQSGLLGGQSRCLECGCDLQWMIRSKAVFTFGRRTALLTLISTFMALSCAFLLSFLALVNNNSEHVISHQLAVYDARYRDYVRDQIVIGLFLRNVGDRSNIKNINPPDPSVFVKRMMAGRSWGDTLFYVRWYHIAAAGIGVVSLGVSGLILIANPRSVPDSKPDVYLKILFWSSHLTSIGCSIFLILRVVIN